MTTLKGEIKTLPKMNGVISQTATFGGNIGAKTINIGEDGATFIPSVSSDGIISWTNDKELPNPEPVNIKGKDGYTPIKGIDYFDGKDGYTPIKGVDYHDGKDGKDGANGKDGYTPIKGVDYFDGKDGQPGKDGADGSDGYTPVKGVDYFDGVDGSDGEDGYTPIKGTDYWTEEDKTEMISDVLSHFVDVSEVGY